MRIEAVCVEFCDINAAIDGIFLVSAVWEEIWHLIKRVVSGWLEQWHLIRWST